MGQYMAGQSLNSIGARQKFWALTQRRKCQPQGSPLSPVIFGLTCGRILKELPDGCIYVDDCTWSIPFDSLSDKNELASKVQRLLNKIQAVFSRHGMELDEKTTELAVIYKANQKCKQWEMEANRWSMRWHDEMIQFNKGGTTWLGYHLDRCLNWHAHVDTVYSEPSGNSTIRRDRIGGG
jgi:hypothetical protein